jgi:multiple antibiotic resistance protein
MRHYVVMTSITSLAIIFFLIIDPLGTLPVFHEIVKKKSDQQRLMFTFIELLIALFAMISFIFVGKLIVYILDISKTTTEMAGGVMLFLIALKMIFSSKENVKEWSQEQSYVVPVAIPLLAGPSLLAALTVYAKLETTLFVLISAIFIAWALSLVVYLFGKNIYGLIGDKGLLACQRLMGLLIALVASELFLQGVQDFLGRGNL